MTKKATTSTTKASTKTTTAAPQTWIRGVNIGGWLVAEPFITPYLFAVNSCHVRGDFCWYPGQIGAPSEAESDNVNVCDPKRCEPILPILDRDGEANYHPLFPKTYMNYPIDEYTLGQTFEKYGVEDEFGGDYDDEEEGDRTTTNPMRKTVGQRYMERHWDTFLTKDDLIQLHDAGVTHLRVPMGYWVRGGKTAAFEQVDIDSDMKLGDDTDNEQVEVEDEPYISGSWPYFQRMVQWCREINANNPTKPALQIWPDLHG